MDVQIPMELSHKNVIQRNLGSTITLIQMQFIENILSIEIVQKSNEIPTVQEDI
jgi:hypothetical protein